jgi:hypothetical protein
MRVPIDVRITLESSRRAGIGGRLKSATSGLMHHISIPGDKVDGLSSTLNKAAAGSDWFAGEPCKFSSFSS